MKKPKIKTLINLTGFAILFFWSVMVFAEPVVWVDPATGRITIKAPREKIKEVEEIISRFPAQPRQIEIEARIIEVSEEVTKKFGTSLERLTGLEVPVGTTGEGSKIAFGPKTLTELEEGKGALEFNFYRLTAEERFEMILNMLLTEGKARVLSSPRVSTLSGEVAGIYVTTEIPYLASITYRIVGEKEIPEEHYEYATVGIVLQVLPRIVGEDLVEMSVIPLVGNYEISPEFGAQHPIFKRQISPTNVTVKDGESLVIGGLITRDKSKRVIGLPVLSHLPVLGGLFRSQVEIIKEKSLLITVKPHILKPREIKGRVKRIFHLKYGLASEVAGQVRELLSSQGSIEVNPKEAPPNSILVRDLEDRIRVIQSFLNQTGTFQAQRRQKKYPLVYTTLEEAMVTVEKLLSKHGSVRMEEGNVLIVEDGAYQISLIDEAIRALERHNSFPQIKTFNLKFVADKQAVREILPLLSPRGSCKITKERVLLVEDNNWVIQKVSEKLKELDTFDSQKETKVYSLKNEIVSELLKSASFQQVVKAELSPQCKIIPREETNELLITEVNWKQKKVKEIVKSFDTYRKVEATYEVKFWFASSLKSKLTPLLTPQGEMVVDEDKNSLIIKDSPYRIKKIGDEIKKLDRFELVKSEERLTVQYLPLEKAIQIAREQMSSQGKILKIEKKRRSFTIEEAPFPLRKIREKIEKLDTFEKNRVAEFYLLKHVSPEEAALVVRYFLSPRGKVYAGEDRILVIDAPYYQRQVGEVIRLIDLPNSK